MTHTILTSIVVAICITVMAGCTTEQESSMTESERMIAIARKELHRLNVPVENRVPVVVYKNSTAVVTFPPPTDARAGDFIIQVDRTSAKVIDTKIWR